MSNATSTAAGGCQADRLRERSEPAPAGAVRAPRARPLVRRKGLHCICGHNPRFHTATGCYGLPLDGNWRTPHCSCRRDYINGAYHTIPGCEVANTIQQLSLTENVDEHEAIRRLKARGIIKQDGKHLQFNFRAR